jgi:hypothetical protein|tara:strand:+ start:59 stop:268 length:210 start_codon:yes stop_codon:yes gene_type:complete
MQLTDQALGALMLALQNSLMNQTDIVPVLKEFNFTETDNGLIVDNPPVVDLSGDEEDSVVFDALIDAIE